MSTPFSVEDAKEIDPYTNYHKIASYEISHLRLIEYIARTGKHTFLSTGAANKEEVRWAVEKFFASGGKKITLLQTTAKYPAPIDTLNLKAMIDLRNEFDLDVGLSDHSVNPIIGPVIATALGASAIEKHFTVDQKLPGPDHSFALNPIQLKEMIKAVRDAEKSLGKGEKIVLDEEFELRDYAQRTIQCIKQISRGDKFVEAENVDVLRSGKQRKGLHPKFLEKIQGMKSNLKGEELETFLNAYHIKLILNEWSKINN